MPDKKSKKKLSLSFSPEGEERLIPEEDEEFERAAAERYREELEADEAQLRAAEKRAEQQKRDYEQKLRQEKIAMMKAKQGIADEPEEDAEEEEDEPQAEMSLGKKIENFWYHYKWVTIITVVVVLCSGYAIYEHLTRVRPDITIIVTADNGLSYRADAMKTLFEKYAEDINGDGKVNVEIVFTPMDPEGGTDQYTQANETKLVANLSNAQCVLYITDEDSSFSLEQVLFDDLSKKLDSKYVTEDGISFDSAMIREGFNWAMMPDDVVLKIRTPVQTLASSAEDMQETYDDAIRFIEALVDAMDKYDEANS